MTIFIRIARLTFIGCIILFSSCESHEQKVDDAFDKVKELKSEPGYIQPVASKSAPEKTAKKSIVIKVVKEQTPDEWTVFEAETDLKLKESESRIKALKARRDFPVNKYKFDNQIMHLELDNNKLRKRMNDYHEEVKIKWEKFKVGMNHDIDELDIELRGVKIDNEKPAGSIKKAKH